VSRLHARRSARSAAKDKSAIAARLQKRRVFGAGTEEMHRALETGRKHTDAVLLDRCAIALFIRLLILS
jgi:hypothetical protein